MLSNAAQDAGPHDEDDGRTQGIGGVDIARMKIPRHLFDLQIYGTNGQWHEWAPIPASGRNVGRSKESANFPGLNTMAVRHMRFSYDRATLSVEDLGSLNGVYLRISEPVELTDGLRFRIGSQVIEFRLPEPFDAASPIVSDEGEEFCSRDLEPFAYLELIRPDTRPGVRFPITHPDVTILGRERAGVNIVLANDSTVSGEHARIRRADGKFYLEDANSRNGTFVHLIGPTALKSGDILLAGRMLFRVQGHGAG